MCWSRTSGAGAPPPYPGFQSGAGREGSHLRPAAEQVVVDARELDGGRVVRPLAAHLLDGRIEIEQQGPFRVVAHHALDPEERADPRPTRHRADVMEAGRRIEHEMAGRQ